MGLKGQAAWPWVAPGGVAGPGGGLSSPGAARVTWWPRRQGVLGVADQVLAVALVPLLVVVGAGDSVTPAIEDRVNYSGCPGAR